MSSERMCSHKYCRRWRTPNYPYSIYPSLRTSNSKLWSIQVIFTRSLMTQKQFYGSAGINRKTSHLPLKTKQNNKHFLLIHSPHRCKKGSHLQRIIKPLLTVPRRMFTSAEQSQSLELERNVWQRFINETSQIGIIFPANDVHAMWLNLPLNPNGQCASFIKAPWGISGRTVCIQKHWYNIQHPQKNTSHLKVNLTAPGKRCR